LFDYRYILEGPTGVQAKPFKIQYNIKRDESERKTLVGRFKTSSRWTSQLSYSRNRGLDGTGHKVTLVFAPSCCQTRLEEVTSNFSSVEGQAADSRQMVIYSPTLQVGIDGGWDAGIAVFPTLLRRKLELAEPFTTWGVTEKLNRRKLRAVKKAYPDVPSFALASLKGLVSLSLEKA
jgi:hypothetical protein